MKTNAYAGLMALSVAALLGGAAAAQTAVAPVAGAPAHARHARLDTDGDSRISQAEFVQARTARLAALDTDHDGSVAPAEIQARMQAAGAEHATSRFERLDTDKDGQISRAEFDAGAARHGEGGRSGHGDRSARHADRGMGQDGEQRGARMAARGPVAIADVQARATAAFTRLDTDHDGYLTAEEARAGRGDRAVRPDRGHGRRARGSDAAAETPASPVTPASE